MKEISKEILQKYNIADIKLCEEIKGNKAEGDMIFYQTFLNATDYLAIKLAEGLITREDKKAEFDARDFCRAEINRLQAEK